MKRDAKGGPTWVDELADELDSDSDETTSKCMALFYCIDMDRFSSWSRLH